MPKKNTDEGAPPEAAPNFETFDEIGLSEPLSDRSRMLAMKFQRRSNREPSRAARRPRSDRPGADGHRQDGRVRASAPRRIDLRRTRSQALVLAPTRELALQVSRGLSTRMQSISARARAPGLRRTADDRAVRPPAAGVHVVVGTPGRVHGPPAARHAGASRHSSASSSTKPTRCCAMGFIDDVDGSSARLPEGVQTALFSATMPREIARVADSHLRDAVEIRIRAQDAHGSDDRSSSYLNVSEQRKARRARRASSKPKSRRRDHLRATRRRARRS